ncbi:hypothetical protein DSLASN_19970 [Desulfoluna limicola]|uniref:Uncharacterized protein n=1 Tax=Desulfoluna limicola TaxID=2810562 RepID=A0ABM7PGP7_9BACT|nr:hypothetical protein [Desulfoluna limicola]BCS96365.1 hypothetical protein DSLASN_19970 [Desulfoluna limicola]
MSKQTDQSYNMLLMIVTAKNQGMSKTQNIRHGFLLDFLTLRASRVHPSPAYQSIEVNHYTCSSDALNMDALSS